MSNQDKKWLYIVIFIVVAFFLWLLLHGNNALSQIVKQNVPWVVPVDTGAGGGGDITIESPEYVPAVMPALSSNKCDGKTPCTFCSIPNAVYPATPSKIVASPTIQTINAVAPKTFNQGPAVSMAYPQDYVGGFWSSF